MRTPSTRTSVISVTAFGVSLLWGLIELFALQWTRLTARGQTSRVPHLS
jgi:hypothetical protein